MNGVGSPPMLVRREREHSQAAAQPVVGALRRKKSAMTAVVLDKKKPDQESHRKRQQCAKQPNMAVHRRPVHGVPDQRERNDRDQQFEYAARQGGRAVLHELQRRRGSVGHVRVNVGIQRVAPVRALGNGIVWILQAFM